MSVTIKCSSSVEKPSILVCVLFARHQVTVYNKVTSREFVSCAGHHSENTQKKPGHALVLRAGCKYQALSHTHDGAIIKAGLACSQGKQRHLAGADIPV